MIESVTLGEALIGGNWHKVRVGKLHYDRRGTELRHVEVIDGFTPFFQPTHGGPSWSDSGNVPLKDIKNQHQCSHKNIEFKYSYGSHDEVEEVFYCLDCHRTLIDSGGFMAVLR